MIMYGMIMLFGLSKKCESLIAEQFLSC